MNCHGCLKENTEGFCPACERKLFERSKVSPQLNFNWEDIQDRLTAAATGFSISGVQAKGFIGRDRNQLLVPNRNTESMYIVKPAIESRSRMHKESPANEHLSMVLASQVFGIETAYCALVRFKNGETAYLVRRFDRDEKKVPLRQEDFVSVFNVHPRKDGMYKYDTYTYEDVGAYLSPFDKIRFLRLLLFNFLTGNADMHLKNISLLETRDGDMILSPAYDLMNTALHLQGPAMAMNLFREMERTRAFLLVKKYDYSLKDFSEWAKRVGMEERIFNRVAEEFRSKTENCNGLIEKSFLSEQAKGEYKKKIELQWGMLFR